MFHGSRALGKSCDAQWKTPFDCNYFLDVRAFLLHDNDPKLVSVFGVWCVIHLLDTNQQQKQSLDSGFFPWILYENFCGTQCQDGH